MLNLSDNWLDELPPRIGRLARLQNLHLCGNRLGCLPYDITELQNLQRLSLERNQFTTIPDFLRLLPQNLMSVDRYLVEGPKSCCSRCPNKDGRMLVAARQTGFAVPNQFCGNEDVAYGTADELIIMNLSTLAGIFLRPLPAFLTRFCAVGCVEGQCRHAFLQEDDESESNYDCRFDCTDWSESAPGASKDCDNTGEDSLSCDAVSQNYISIVHMLRDRECGQTLSCRRKLERRVVTACSQGTCHAVKNKNLVLDSFGYVADLDGMNDTTNPHREPRKLQHEGSNELGSLKPSDSSPEQSHPEVTLQDHPAWLRTNGTGCFVRHGVSSCWGKAERINAQLATICLRARREVGRCCETSDLVCADLIPLLDRKAYSQNLLLQNRL